MALRPLPSIHVVEVDELHKLIATEAGRDPRNGLTASVMFSKQGESPLGCERVAFAVPGSREAAARAWGELNGCPVASLERALLQLAGELEVVQREVESATKSRPPTSDKASGETLNLADPEPWPEPVAGAEVLDEVRGLFDRYLVLGNGCAELLALWVAHTYLFDAFDHTGYLAIVSPQRRSGKTTTLTVLASVVRRPLPAGNVSPAAVYRVIQDQQPTLLVDELDRVQRDSDLWTVLNAGHTRGTPVIRTSGENLEPRSFATFGPKVLVYIRKPRTSIPDTVEDRSIRVMLQRQTAGERRPKVRSNTLKSEAGPIRSRLMRWARDVGDKLPSPQVPAALDDRAADSWEPLLALAAAAGQGWLARAADLAVSFSAIRASEEAEDDIGALLLGDLAELIENERLDLSIGLSSEEAVRELVALRERPWSAYGRSGKPIATTTLARMLKVYGLESKLTGPKTMRVKRYPADELRNVIARYVVRDSAPPASTLSPSHQPESAPASCSKDSGERVRESRPLTGGERGDESLPVADTDEAACRICGSDSCPGDCCRIDGRLFRAGDFLPDGRQVLEVTGGVPIVSRRKA
jgi:putative DNA primase/helicase